MRRNTKEGGGLPFRLRLPDGTMQELLGRKGCDYNSLSRLCEHLGIGVHNPVDSAG
jgi:hypothetical protein